MRRLIWIGLILFPALTPAPPTATAETIKIAGFYGAFKGSGVAKNRDSLYFGVTVRDLDVTIRPAGAGFEIEWTTVIRRGGNPARPKIRRKTQKMTFAATDKPNVFRARKTADPLSGEPYAWARIEDTSLIVHVLSINEDGSYDMQNYTRTLVPTGMAFVFQRIRDGDPVRTVKGKLIKYSQ